MVPNIQSIVDHVSREEGFSPTNGQHPRSNDASVGSRVGGRRVSRVELQLTDGTATAQLLSPQAKLIGAPHQHARSQYRGRDGGVLAVDQVATGLLSESSTGFAKSRRGHQQTSAAYTHKDWADHVAMRHGGALVHGISF